MRQEAVGHAASKFGEAFSVGTGGVWGDASSAATNDVLPGSHTHGWSTLPLAALPRRAGTPFAALFRKRSIAREGSSRTSSAMTWSGLGLGLGLEPGLGKS